MMLWSHRCPDGACSASGIHLYVSSAHEVPELVASAQPVAGTVQFLAATWHSSCLPASLQKRVWVQHLCDFMLRELLIHSVSTWRQVKSQQPDTCIMLMVLSPSCCGGSDACPPRTLVGTTTSWRPFACMGLQQPDKLHLTFEAVGQPRSTCAVCFRCRSEDINLLAEGSATATPGGSGKFRGSLSGAEIPGTAASARQAGRALAATLFRECNTLRQELGPAADVGSNLVLRNALALQLWLRLHLLAACMGESDTAAGLQAGVLVLEFQLLQDCANLTQAS